MRTTLLSVRLLGLIVLTALLPACIGGKSVPSRFYVLQPLAPPAAGPEDAMSVAVEPVSLPSSLDRPQIVTLRGAHERGIAELHRWAEPLESGFGRVLSENLSVLLGSQTVHRLPTRSDFSWDRVVSVEVQEFGATPGAECVLTARWRVLDRGHRPLVARQKTYRAPAGDDHLAHVEAMSRVLADLSREIAAALQQ